MARKIIVGILLSSLLLTAGCSLIVKTAFGIDEIKEYRDTDVQSFLVESQRKVSCRQIVASIGQQDSLIRLDLDSTMMQHRGQPVQILYFDGDSLLFYHINCYTQSGLFQFNWNNYHSFDHFPPSPTVVVPHNKESMTLSNYTPFPQAFSPLHRPDSLEQRNTQSVCKSCRCRGHEHPRTKRLLPMAGQHRPMVGKLPQ